MRAAGALLDLVFMVDATGSMADEIDKLRDSLQGIVRDIACCRPTRISAWAW